MRQVNPLVEGSSPSPVICDRKRIKAAGCHKTPSFTERNALSSPAHLSPSSRQNAADSGSIPPSTATKNAPSDCGVVATTDDPDLAAIVAAWPELPEVIRAGILAMVRAASK